MNNCPRKDVVLFSALALSLQLGSNNDVIAKTSIAIRIAPPISGDRPPIEVRINDNYSVIFFARYRKNGDFVIGPLFAKYLFLGHGIR